MANQGKVLMGGGNSLDTEGAVSNVATMQAQQARLESLNVDGQYIRPDWVQARGLTLGESLSVGSGVILTNGCVDTVHLAADSVTTAKIDAGAVTATEINVSTLSAISANLGTITSGSLAVGYGGVSIGDVSAGVSISGNIIRCIKSSTTTVEIDGSTGILTASKFNLTSDSASTVNLSAGTITIGQSATIGDPTAGVSISSNVIRCMKDGAATVTIDGSTGVLTCGKVALTTDADSSVNLTLGSVTIGQGAVIGDVTAGVSISSNVIRCIKSGVTTVSIDGSTGIITASKFNLTSDSASTVNFTAGSITVGANASLGGTTCSTVVSNASTGASRNQTFYAASAPTASNTGDVWVDSDDLKMYRWNGTDWTTQAITTRAYAQATKPTTGTVKGDVWVDTDDGNKVYVHNGTDFAAVLDAVQPGNGFGVDANNYPNTISLDSSGIEIYTASSGARLLLNNAGLSAKASISGTAKDVVTLDSTNGIRIINYTSTPSVAERLSLAYNNGSTTTEYGAIYGKSTGCIMEATGQMYISGTTSIRLNSGGLLTINGQVTLDSYIGDATRTTLYRRDDSSNTQISVSRIKIGDETKYVVMYIATFASGADAQDYAAASGGTAGEWGAAGDVCFSTGGSMWVRVAASPYWQRCGTTW